MTNLHTYFLDHLLLSGYAEATIKNYIQSVSLLARYYNKSPLLLTAKNIIAYLLHLRNIKKPAIRTYNIHFYSIKCFYEHFMPETNMIGDLRQMKFERISGRYPARAGRKKYDYFGRPARTRRPSSVLSAKLSRS